MLLELVLMTSMAQGISAPETQKPKETARDEIVVSGEKPAEKEPHITVGEKKIQVIVGSRIPRKPIYGDNHFIKTNTGTRGLTPGSGMDPGANIAPSKKIRSCKSDDPELTSKLSCSLQQAQQAIGAQDWGGARAALEHLQTGAGANAASRFRAAELEYKMASLTNDDEGRMTALQKMVDSGRLNEDQQVSAHKSLVAMALKSDDVAMAIDHSLSIGQFAPDDATNQANLAALYQRSGDIARARVAMQEAVDIKNSTGEQPPQNWVQFLKAHPE